MAQALESWEQAVRKAVGRRFTTGLERFLGIDLKLRCMGPKASQGIY